MLFLKFLSIEINEVFLGMNSECVNLLIIFAINQRLKERYQVQYPQAFGESCRQTAQPALVFFFSCSVPLTSGIGFIICLVVLVNPEGLCPLSSRSLCAHMHSNSPAPGAAYSARC